MSNLVAPLGDDSVLQALKKPLSDFHGSVSVTQPQNFDAIRQKILGERAYRTEEA